MVAQSSQHPLGTSTVVRFASRRIQGGNWLWWTALVLAMFCCLFSWWIDREKTVFNYDKVLSVMHTVMY